MNEKAKEIANKFNIPSEKLNDNGVYNPEDIEKKAIEFVESYLNDFLNSMLSEGYKIVVKVKKNE